MKIITVLITEALCAIEKTSAEFFPAKGWNVIGTMCSSEKERELEEMENVTVLPLDITHINEI